MVLMLLVLESSSLYDNGNDVVNDEFIYYHIKKITLP